MEACGALRYPCGALWRLAAPCGTLAAPYGGLRRPAVPLRRPMEACGALRYPCGALKKRVDRYLYYYSHSIKYCIFKRHQWLIQNLIMKTCSFLDPVTSKFLLIVNVKCELCIWKTKPLMPCPGPFSIADFFIRYSICTYWQVQT